MNSKLNKKYLYFSVIYIALIILISLFGRPIAGFLRDENKLRIVLAFMGLSIWFLFSYKAYRYLKNQKLKFWIFVAVFSVIFIGTYFSIALPEERLHLVEYTILPLLVSNIGIRQTSIFDKVKVPVLCLLVGLADESLQEVFPGRYFEWSDVYLNWFGSVLGSFSSMLLQSNWSKKS